MKKDHPNKKENNESLESEFNQWLTVFFPQLHSSFSQDQRRELFTLRWKASSKEGEEWPSSWKGQTLSQHQQTIQNFKETIIDFLSQQDDKKYLIEFQQSISFIEQTQKQEGLPPDFQWEHKPPEMEGNYWFSGQFFATQGVVSLLSEPEIRAIYIYIQQLVEREQWIDYLQVFVHKQTKTKLFFSDQIQKDRLDNGDYNEEDNYCTLMLASEW